MSEEHHGFRPGLGYEHPVERVGVEEGQGLQCFHVPFLDRQAFVFSLGSS